MKEVEEHKIDKTEVVNQRQIEKQKKLVSKLKPKPGQTVYELNCKSGVVQPATFKNERVQLVARRNLFTFKKQLVQKRVKVIDFKPGFLYVCALNEENAAKKFMKALQKLS